jgi:hypothetical protein
MNDSNRAADRVRPFLQAMERSIDAARQRRLNGGLEPTEPAPVMTPTSPPANEPSTEPSTEPSGEPPRLRARPKRPSYPVFGRDEPEYRSKAG